MYTIASYQVDKTDIAQCSSDQQLREIVKQLPNGGYASRICVRCGSYFVKQDAHIENAEIVQVCTNCFDNNI